jgi:Membrane bound beta barrel domain (DUF5777)
MPLATRFGRNLIHRPAIRPGSRLISFVVMLVCLSSHAAAQTPAETPPPTPPASKPLPAEPEQNLVNLSTTQPLKRHGSYFRITHRFARDLRRGSFEDLAESLFSLDDGAIIGLEYRFAPTSRLQAGIHRSMFAKTIWVFSRYDGWRQGESFPVSLSFAASVEGTNNLSDNHAPGIGAVVSRAFGNVVSVYASPTFVWSSRLDTDITGHEGHEEHDVDMPAAADLGAEGQNTFFVGLGARVRFRPTAYVSFEIAPRLAGYDPLGSSWGVAIEKHTWGHMFQLNFTNNFGTTYGQIARGGSEHDVYLGFNITRTF